MSGARPSGFALVSPGPLPLYSTVELLKLAPPTWLVHGIIPSGGLVGLYGQPGTCKSFVAVDLAMSVASGRPWHGHEVQKGPVLYISAEGGTGIGKRAGAWCSVYQADPAECRVAWLTQSISVYFGSEDMEALFERIDELRESWKPVLIIIDTLARCFDGDENKQEDMGRFVAGVDRLRLECGATVVVVHHTRLDDTRERGSTVFRGAADTMLSLKRTPERIDFYCNKQKDSEEFDMKTFVLKTVPLWDSAVIMDEGAEARVIIATELREKPLGFSALLRRANIPKTTFRRALKRSLEIGEITKENGIYKLKRGHAK